MTKRMLIDANHPEETRVVILDGSKVEEFDFEAASKRPLKGNIYLAKVTRVEPSLQAAFVEYGGNRQGFLAFAEIHPDYYQIPVADRQALLAEQEAEVIAAYSPWLTLQRSAIRDGWVVLVGRTPDPALLARGALHDRRRPRGLLAAVALLALALLLQIAHRERAALADVPVIGAPIVPTTEAILTMAPVSFSSTRRRATCWVAKKVARALVSKVRL